MTCGDLRETHVGQTVRLAGWVMTIRNHGGIIFIDLRDQYGVTQVVITEEMERTIGKEFSVSVKGKVLGRAEDTYNPSIETGKVEISAEELEILGPCRAALPFEIDASRDTREELRLKYRYLDLRNPKLKDNLILRSEVIAHLRREMEGMDFLEVQTPILANSSPEGARDYLVPSRKHKGKFYALPQAPQQFKQLLMASGVDKYYQIAPCFRDEDARLDRSPGEFYQLDFEMAYATQEDVFAVAERVLTSVFKRFSRKKISAAPFVRIPYAEAMLRYGSDKPDLRNPLRIIDLSDFFSAVDFAPFKGRIVRAVRVPGAAAQPRSFFREMEKFALQIGMKGLGYVSVQPDLSCKGPIDKFLSDGQKREMAGLAGLAAGDVLYFISDEPGKAASFAGQIRAEAAERLGLIDKERFDFCFVTDYPMYEASEDAGKIDFTHNPFSMPQGEMAALQENDPLDILAWQYDLVCNGVELSSGAVRNHRPDIMVKAFEIAGYTEKDVEEKFGALYNAFHFGAPPHAGMAPGVDRIVMLLAGEENIREIIAFPLNSNAQNLMLDAPGEVTEQQLRDVHVKIR
ncbi:MAG: aspartate--tRNA ligase [Clostridiales Family XIII bacterium]|nr:aspartate--tRNA ligase [Clostridiales Family XIII bacterium]